MGVDLRRAYPAAERLFVLADELTGLPLRDLCETGPLERLTATDVAQPAVVVTSLAALTVLRDCGEVPLEAIAVAGHSVGEVAATCAAGALSEQATIQLVRDRAEAMACACELVDGTMAAVLGLDESLVSAVCAEASGRDGAVEVANVNAPGQIVISGERAAVERAIAGARAAGARRAMPLTVGGPFHSRYMEPAEPPLRRTLASVDLCTAGRAARGKRERGAAALGGGGARRAVRPGGSAGALGCLLAAVTRAGLRSLPRARSWPGADGSGQAHPAGRARCQLRAPGRPGCRPGGDRW